MTLIVGWLKGADEKEKNKDKRKGDDQPMGLSSTAVGRRFAPERSRHAISPGGGRSEDPLDVWTEGNWRNFCLEAFRGREVGWDLEEIKGVGNREVELEG